LLVTRTIEDTRSRKMAITIWNLTRKN
jgi:hypothetical protein